MDNFAIYEFLLYAGLIARRLKAPYLATQGLLVSGIIVYGLTRIIQAILLVYLFAGSYGRMDRANDISLWWLLLVGCIALIVLQTITFPIYHGIILRTQQQHTKAKEEQKLTCVTTNDVDIEVRRSFMAPAEAATSAIAEAAASAIAEVRRSFCAPATTDDADIEVRRSFLAPAELCKSRSRKSFLPPV